MSEQDDRPAYSFNPGPPPEASAFLRNKGFLPAFSYLDVEAEEHAVAFTVAKATSLDVLKDIREELQTALDDGLPFAEFQRRLRPRLQARGWWGYGGAMDGPRGERPALLGTPRRLRVIYDANLRSARAAGQWERIERSRDRLPYLTYRLGPSERHRPHHETKEGLTLLVTDPFWDQWMPPNGWGCKCWVRQITAAEAERIGIDQSPVIETRPFENRRTGEITYVPVGIDPSWERNPGKLRREGLEALTNGRLETLSPLQAVAATRDFASSWIVRRVIEGGTDARVPIAVLPAAVAETVGVSRTATFDARASRHILDEADDRTVGDLTEVGRLALGGRFRVQVDAKGRRSLHVLIDGTDQVDAPQSRDRNPVYAIFHFGEGTAYLRTMFRTNRSKWERRMAERPGDWISTE